MSLLHFLFYHGFDMCTLFMKMSVMFLVFLVTPTHNAGQLFV